MLQKLFNEMYYFGLLGKFKKRKFSQFNRLENLLFVCKQQDFFNSFVGNYDVPSLFLQQYTQQQQRWQRPV